MQVLKYFWYYQNRKKIKKEKIIKKIGFLNHSGTRLDDIKSRNGRKQTPSEIEKNYGNKTEIFFVHDDP